VPIRQFLKQEGVSVPKEKTDARIKALKEDPNPFGTPRPTPLTHVMVRECITWDDLRLMIVADIGMGMWAEREWQKQFPTLESWDEYCWQEDSEFRDRFGKFVVIPFILDRWPEGAKDEEEAKAILKKRAEAAREQLSGGKSADPSVRGRKAEIAPFSCFGEDNASHLKALAAGHVSRPMEVRYGWYLLKRVSLTEKDVSDFLKGKYLSDTREEAENRIRTEAVIEETSPDVE
jgi:hypothetical protein